MKYKVGDYVRIKSLDWYNRNKDNYGAIYAGNGFCFWKNMSRHCGEIMKITIVKVDPEDSNKGYYFMENCEERWTDGMIECLVEDEMKSEDGLLDEYEELTDRAFKGGYEKCKSDIKLNGFQLPEGYRFVDESGNIINATKIVLEKKKKECPKTFDKCCHIMQTAFLCDVRLHKGKYYDIFYALAKLIVCRDAYWKIAGEEMGLGKPWEYGCNSKCYTPAIICRDGYIQKVEVICRNAILAFPTAEMRDVFYENFKEIIEQCKELL